jgi:hypothetical protein
MGNRPEGPIRKVEEEEEEEEEGGGGGGGGEEEVYLHYYKNMYIYTSFYHIYKNTSNEYTDEM